MMICACGSPLHYQDKTKQKLVERMIDLLGPDMRVTVGERTWLVPRHYIALHGIVAKELPSLGFPEVKCDAAL